MYWGSIVFVSGRIEVSKVDHHISCCEEGGPPEEYPKKPLPPNEKTMALLQVINGGMGTLRKPPTPH
jgi:hypothetical protein